MKVKALHHTKNPTQMMWVFPADSPLSGDCVGVYDWQLAPSPVGFAVLVGVGHIAPLSLCIVHKWSLVTSRKFSARVRLPESNQQG